MPALSTLRRRAPKRVLPFVSAKIPGVTPLAAEPGQPPVHFSNDPNSIVDVIVKTINAPTSNTYQQCGALVTWGGTSLPEQSVFELTQFSDLNQIVIAPTDIESISWASGVATYTLSDPLPPGFNTVGATIQMNVTGCFPTEYNGALAMTVVSGTSLTTPITTDPGPVTTKGSVQPGSASQLTQMASTYFAQGNSVSVWVLELGVATGPGSFNPDTLISWLTNNPRSFYGYLLPRECGASTANIDILKPVYALYQSPESMTYFWLTVSIDVLGYLDPTNKCVFEVIEAPVTLTNEFTAAAMFYNGITYTASQINRVAPMAFKYLYGVTAYPTQNNGPLLSSLKANHVNYVSTGAQGGIAYNIIYYGVTLDGKDYFNWWWTIDWVQINAQLDVANAIVNGSNNPLSPLYYDQNGIRFLLSTLANTMNTASAFGMVNGQVVITEFSQPQLSNAIATGVFAGACDVNAVPFIPYTLANPGDFDMGEYDGLSVLFIPARGFIHVLITIVASSLVTV